MRVSQMFIPTLREVPAEAEIASHKLMLRAGLIRKLAAGVYSFLPLGYRTLRKIEQIVREEMDRAGAQELLMPALLPMEALQASGTGEAFEAEIFRLKDRGGRNFCLAPGHEEIFAETVRHGTRSYRSLPLLLYQIQAGYRDEMRPRHGAMRSREFLVKEACSFDRDEEGLDNSSRKMYEVCCRIFERCGLEYRTVEGDPGTMGTDCLEFMTASEIGETVFAFCQDCGYAANDETAKCVSPFSPSGESYTREEGLPVEKVATPGIKTIEELTKFFACTPEKFAKTLICKADHRVIAAVVRGDRELSQVKLRNYLGCTLLEMADSETVKAVTGAEVGFAGPIGLEIEVVVDLEAAKMANAVVGANDTGYHFKNVHMGRDFKASAVTDLRRIAEGDRCPACGSTVKLARGIKVGHVSRMGTGYGKAQGCVYLDEAGKEQPMAMGCYGIGISRLMASIIEQNNDENGIIWPMAVAPYPVVILPVSTENSLQMELAEKLHRELQAAGIEVLLDDRNERAGVKFKDADLIGIPLRITVGKKAGEGIVEYKLRKTAGIKEIRVEEVLDEVRKAMA